jgi:hypothetical protein
MMNNMQFDMMRRMLGRDGFRFVRQSESGSVSPKGKIVASYTNAKGNKWVCLCTNKGANPAQIDLAEQLLRWTADQET